MQTFQIEQTPVLERQSYSSQCAVQFEYVQSCSKKNFNNFFPYLSTVNSLTLVYVVSIETEYMITLLYEWLKWCSYSDNLHYSQRQTKNSKDFTMIKEIVLVLRPRFSCLCLCRDKCVGKCCNKKTIERKTDCNRKLKNFL